MTARRASNRPRSWFALGLIVVGLGLVGPGCRATPDRPGGDPDGDGEVPNAERTDNVRKVFEHGQDS